MRVLLADDHALLLEGLQNLLEAHDIEVVGTARDGCEAAAQARKLRPEVILMDIRMPVCDGLCATRIIKSEMPEIKIVILTTSSEDQDLFEAIKSGAGGYLLKSMDAESLIEALHDAQQDIPPFASGLAARLMAEFARTTAASSAGTQAGAPSNEDVRTEAAMPAVPLEEDAITQRQAEVLSLVAQGLTYREVGARLYLSPRTVKYHMAEIMRKLHVQNRAQVLALAGAIVLEQTEDTP
jgi:DNA-binding NarL/FixJ family response regulator